MLLRYGLSFVFGFVAVVAASVLVYLLWLRFRDWSLRRAWDRRIQGHQRPAWGRVALLGIPATDVPAGETVTIELAPQRRMMPRWLSTPEQLDWCEIVRVTYGTRAALIAPNRLAFFSSELTELELEATWVEIPQVIGVTVRNHDSQPHVFRGLIKGLMEDKCRSAEFAEGSRA